jgi:transposase InsO family protein
MEAIPLSDTSAAACTKALISSWISRFEIAETITSDSRTQFTSNIWSKLCEMLHISHCQTTAYHPESNSAVERLHRGLKDALRARTAAVTWSEGLPFVLSLRAQPRKETGLSRAEAVFGTPIVLPNEFLHGDEFSVDEIVKKIFKNFACSCCFLAQAQFQYPAAGRAARRAAVRPLCLVASRQHRPASPPPLQ